MKKIKDEKGMNKKEMSAKRRYDEKNPSVTFRMSKEEKLELEKFCGIMDMSVSEIIHDFFFSQKEGAIVLFINGIDYGRQLEKNLNLIWYYCSICHQKMFIEPNTLVHHAMIQYMLEHGWGHSECINKKPL